MPEPYTREGLAADTDRAISFFRNSHSSLSRSAEGQLYTSLADVVAQVIGCEFAERPDLGRVLVSASRVMKGISDGARAVGVDTDGLLAVLALAGEQLDRGARDA